MVGTEKSGGLRREGCGSGVRLGEGCCVCCVRDYFIKGTECDGLAAAVLCSGGLETELGHCGDGEVTIGTGEFGVGFVILVTLYFVDVGVRRRLCMLKVEGSIAGIWKGFWGWYRFRDFAELLSCLESVSPSGMACFSQPLSYMLYLSDAYSRLPTIRFD